MKVQKLKKLKNKTKKRNHSLMMVDREKLRDLEVKKEWQLFKKDCKRPRNSCEDADCR